jgi:hypothetical protein
MPGKNEQDIWVKACLYEYEVPDIKWSNGPLDRVALAYYEAKYHGQSDDAAYYAARAYANDFDHRLGDDHILERVEKADFYVNSVETRQAIYFYDEDGEDAGELYCPHPDSLIWKPVEPHEL